MVWNIFNLCLKLVRGSPQHGHHQNLPNITCSFCTTRWHWRSRNCSLQSLPGNKCDILHFPEGGWGRNGAPWNAGGNLSEPCWGWQGRQQPTGKAAQEMPQGKPFSSTGRVFFMVRALQLPVEEVRSQPFSQGLFWHFLRALWLPAVVRGLLFCHKNQDHRREFAAVYCSSARVENSMPS